MEMMTVNTTTRENGGRAELLCMLTQRRSCSGMYKVMVSDGGGTNGNGDE